MERLSNDPIFARLRKERRVERLVLLVLVLLTVVTWALVLSPVVA